MADWYEQALNAGQGFKSEEEKLAYFEDLGDPLCHPMFATDAETLEGHPLVDAIRAIKEEDKSFTELAGMYKEEGNQWMKKKTIKETREAFNCYAVAIGHAEKALAQNEEGSIADLYTLLSQSYANRALCSLFLKNYRAAYVDSCKALQFDSGNVKAHFRKCKALFSSKRYEDGLRACNEAMRIDPENAELLKLKEQCQAELAKKAAVQARRREEREALRARLRQSWEVAAQRGACLGLPRPTHPDQFENNIYPTHQLAVVQTEAGSEEEVTTDFWPLLCLYPQYNQIDVLHAIPGDELLVMVLSQMFSEPGDGETPPWDAYREYYLSKLVVYIPINQNEKTSDVEVWAEKMCASLLREESKKSAHDSAAATFATPAGIGWAEVHMGCTIAQILSHPNHILDGGLLQFTIFVRDNAAHVAFVERCHKGGVVFEYLAPVGAPVGK